MSSDAVGRQKTPPDFYGKAAAYWDSVDASVKGMLGGLQLVNTPDLASSHELLDRVGPSRRDRALDCGAGIGRVTRGLLLPRFRSVDMVEVTAKFLDKAEEYIGPELFPRVGHRFNISLHVSTLRLI